MFKAIGLGILAFMFLPNLETAATAEGAAWDSLAPLLVLLGLYAAIVYPIRLARRRIRRAMLNRRIASGRTTPAPKVSDAQPDFDPAH